MASTSTEKQWTIMVYLAGDNNLDDAGVTDIQEMKKVGSTDHVNILVQFDRAGANIATKRYYIRKGGNVGKDEVENLGETNMGDPKVLESFIQWGLKTYPAQRYMLVLWNHGAGWDDTDIYRVARQSLHLNLQRRGTTVVPAQGKARGAVSLRRVRIVGSKRFRRALFRPSIEKALRPGKQNRAIAFDDTSKDFLDNIETKKILASTAKALGRKIDILGMDACLMSMLEVGYQLRDSVGVTVGSEEIEPGDGWPYDAVLSTLVKKPTMNAQDLASTIVKKYITSYGAGYDVTQAACDLNKATSMAEAVNSLAKTLTTQLNNSTEKAAILQARHQVQSYETIEYIDLYDFCDLLAGQSQNAEVRSACQKVKETIATNEFVLESAHKGEKMANSHGVSIYFPERSISPLYATLDFTKKTKWDEFLRAYQSSTRRPR